VVLIDLEAAELSRPAKLSVVREIAEVFTCLAAGRSATDPSNHVGHTLFSSPLLRWFVGGAASGTGGGDEVCQKRDESRDEAMGQERE